MSGQGFIFESGLGSGLPPGVRPVLHEPDRLWGWVFGQHQVWVDRHGSEHEIDSMPIAYVRNVIAFCQLRAVRIRQLVEIDVLVDVVDLLIHGQREAGARTDL